MNEQTNRPKYVNKETNDGRIVITPGAAVRARGEAGELTPW